MVDWGLLKQYDVGGAIQQGFETGRQQQEQLIGRNALSQLVKNPNDAQAMNALAMVDPSTAFQYQGQQQQRQQEQQQTDIRMRASQGDPQAIAQLAGFDWKAWESLRPDQKDLVKNQTNYVGQSALAISQLPAEQRAAAWDAYIDQGVQMGYTDLGKYRGKYSEQTLQSAIANSGLVENFWKADEVKYTVLPEGATMVPVDQRTGVPLQTTGQGFSTTPPPAAPQAGQVVDGYVFKGGNPADPAAWEPQTQQGGQTPQASGNFPTSAGPILQPR